LRALKYVTVNQRLVKSREALIVPVDTADIRLVGEYPQHDRRLPAARRRGRLFCVKATGDGRGTEPSGRVQLENPSDDRRGALVGDQLLSPGADVVVVLTCGILPLGVTWASAREI
jgi:hypothetical protein